MIKLLRIDHRLLHGQVAFSWTSQIGADCILLVSDTLLDDEFRMTSIKLAKPSGVKVVVKTVKDSIEAIKSGVTDKYKLFIVCESVRDADTLIRALDIKKLNLGGTKPQAGRTEIAKAVFVDEEEKQILKNLMNDGVNIEIQMIPTNKMIRCQDVIK